LRILSVGEGAAVFSAGGKDRLSVLHHTSQDTIELHVCPIGSRRPTWHQVDIHTGAIKRVGGPQSIDDRRAGVGTEPGPPEQWPDTATQERVREGLPLLSDDVPANANARDMESERQRTAREIDREQTIKRQADTIEGYQKREARYELSIAAYKAALALLRDIIHLSDDA